MVEELEQDLDLEGDDAAEVADKTEEQKAKSDDEVQVEDPSEDVDADDQAKTNKANESTETKLPGQDNEETKETVEEPLPKKDYSLMDGITQFLFEDEDPLPILTGYFLKIMEQLLDKQKQSTLEYLLIHQEGRIFNGLLQHLDHHSLATLLIKLIEQQIQPIKKEKWSVDYEIDSDFES